MAEETKPDGLEAWAIRFIQEYGLGPLFFALLLVVGFIAAISWYLSKRSTLKGLALDLNSKRSDQVTKLDEKLAALQGAERELSKLMIEARDLISSVKAGRKLPAELKALRDKMCDCFDHQYLLQLRSYLNQVEALDGKPLAFSRLKNDILPAFHMMNSFLKMINDQDFLDLVGGAKFQIPRGAVGALGWQAGNCLSAFDLTVRSELDSWQQEMEQFIRG